MTFRQAFIEPMEFGRPELLPMFEWGYWPAILKGRDPTDQLRNLLR